MNRSFFPIMIAAALFLSLFRLGAPKLFDVDEAVFSEATREMVISRNWITPTYNGANRYDKPILFYWLMAASYKAFGVNEFGARFPSAVAAVLLGSSLFFFVKYFSGEQAARYASLPAVFSIYYLVYSRAAVTDMTLTLFIALSLFCFYRSSSEVSQDKTMHLYGFYLFSALAFLTKGLIGIVFPFGIALVFMAVTRGPGGMKRVFSFRGILLFAAVAAPWYLAEVAINGREFIDQFFIKHHFRRYTDVISGHRGPLYYYIPVIIVGFFPWISFLPAGIRSAWKGKNALHLFGLVWFAFVFLFFSFSTTKLPNYILPALPAASMLMGEGMSGEDPRWRRYSFLAMGILSLLMGGAFLIGRKYLAALAPADGGWTLAIAAVSLAGGAVSLYSAFSKRDLYVPVAGLMTVLLAILLTKALPLASDYLQGTLHKYSIYAKERLVKDEGVIVFGINNPSIAFYSERKIISANNKEELDSLARKGVHAVAISKAKDMELLRDSGYTLIESDGRYALLETK